MLYEKEYFEESGNIGYEGYSDKPLIQFYWQEAFIQLIDIIRGRRILDIGCGTGKLMELLKKKGANVEGIEISRYATDIAFSKGLQIVARDTLQLNQDSAYDIITAFDVIEHVPDMKCFLNKVKTLLKERGVFIFLTPNAGSEKALTEKEAWYGYNRSLEHLYYFSTSSLKFIFTDVFGGEPILYEATAPDGEGIFGFIRKMPFAGDKKIKRIFETNFSAESIDEGNVIPSCIFLQRLNDRRFIEYAGKYRPFISTHADAEEASIIFSAVRHSESAVSGTGKAQNIESVEATGLPSSKTVTIRAYQAGDECGIVKLFHDVFKREMTIEEWRWKYTGQENDIVHSTVAVNTVGEIVGHYGGIPLRAVYMGKVISILSTCDVMIHRPYRGFWMLKKITNFFKHEAVKNGFRMCHGFPTEETLMLPAEKLGIIERCASIAEAMKAVGFNNNLNRFLLKLSPINFEDKRITNLWEYFKEIQSFAVIRDMDYLRWRYGENPLFSYQIWGLTKRLGKELLGLAVLKVDATEKMYIMDMLHTRKTFIPLLQKVENLASSLGKKKLILWMPERYNSLLTQNGFSLEDRGVLGQIVGDEFIRKDTIASEFHFSMGDTDFL